MTKLYLIRHAEAEGNLYRIAHGHCNGLITNYRGYQQIDALRERFRDVDIDAVYSSDLYRTQITARAIWLPKSLPLQLEPAFREICMGPWEDHTWHELNVKYPEEMYNFNRRADLWRVPGAETAQQVVDRFIPALERVARRHEGGAVAVFSHGMALRTVLGDHAHQAGSLVEEDRLRYDFTHFSAVTAEELMQVSHLVSELILDGMDVETKEMPIAEAKKLGAIALFGEKYGDVVRVVNMGGKSIELCGGTHVENTAKVGPFRIVSESSVASGVRRIEAVTGLAFIDMVDEMNLRLVKAAETLKTTPGELIAKAQSSMAEIRELHQTIEKMKDKVFAGDVDNLMFAAKKVGDLKVVTAVRQGTDANDLRKLGDFLRDKDASIVAVLGTVNGEKVTLLAVCGKNAVASGIKAGDIIRNIAPIVGGKGGGKPDSAMGGGTNALKLDDALAAVDDFVAEHLK